MKHCLMSFRLNKENPSDFGLTGPNDEGLYIRLIDVSIWQSRKLYDNGWGQENGFVRIPYLDFKSLVEIVLNSEDQEDRLGSAEIIIEDHPDELLQYCENIFTVSDKPNIERHRIFFKILKLNLPYNLSIALNQSPEEIEKQHLRWKVISEIVTKVLNSKE
jgi:hypothetical protein